MVAFGGPFHPRGVSSTSWKFDFFCENVFATDIHYNSDLQLKAQCALELSKIEREK